MTRTTPAAALLVIVAALAAACSRGTPAPPVATVSLTANRTRLPLGSPIDLTYRFDVAPNGSIPGDYRVFVQVKNPDGQPLWQDDHDPPIPTSQWKPGQKIEYTRTRFVPLVAYVGDATVEIGLYKDDERLPLMGPNAADNESSARSYKVATLQFQNQSENVFLIFKNGWHPDEYAQDNPALSWKWSQKSAVVSARNPKTDVTVYIEYDARPDLFPEAPQQVALKVDDQTVQTFPAAATSPAIVRVPVAAAQLGTADMVDFRLDIDKAFVPAKLPSGGRDTRELGIRVYHFFVEPK
ncbi:MAG: hypothetical protein IT184_03490 [Acidobacteria bacterium]|nr:hypothetical protein [Acidobacteriota bacterium]